MKRQYKASFLDKNIFDALFRLRKAPEFKFKLGGLLESVSTFDIISNLELENPGSIPPLLAVANNLITRGNPTICSREVSSKLEVLSEGLTDLDFYSALHLVDTRPDLSELFDEDLESNFEKAFLDNHIPKDKRYLTQFFQHQREKRSLTDNAGDAGRVDFSFEAPYFKEVKKTTIYQKEKELKERSVTIIEVDGKRYHHALIDDIRDYETAKFGHTTKRITEANTKGDTQDLVETLSRTDYFKVIESLLRKDFEIVKRIQTYVLAPIAIARLQKVINRFLIAKFEQLKANKKTSIRVAIFERDIPCGNLAVADLNALLENLAGLENKQAFIPKIEPTIFADRNFFNQHLQPRNCKFTDDNILADEFDLVIDIAVLWRTGIFGNDADFQDFPNSIVIRSSHYTEHNCQNGLYCTNKVEYRDLTVEIGNEQHSEIQEALPFIEYFLRNIFHKEKFRKGQLPILNRALKNETVIGLLPTGGGKSLTYQLATLLQPGITIIVDPIRSLMVDQYEGLLSIGIDKCDFINSILNREEKVFVQDKVLPFGKTQFLFCSPERLVIQEFRDALAKTNDEGFFFSYCVIDEAHCVSEWGHDFRTPYLNLGENAIEYCKTFDGSSIPIFGLTATASFDVLADIERELKINQNDGNAVIRYENTVRDEINYQIHPINIDTQTLLPRGRQINKQDVGDRKLQRTQTIITNINETDKLLLKYNNSNVYSEILRKTYQNYLPNSEQTKITEAEFVRINTEQILLKQVDLPFRKKDESKFNYGAIIFCPHKTSELGVETYIERLQSINDKIVFFKGSGNSADRDEQDKRSFENLKCFKEDEASVMVATKAFGMGIDKPNVRLTVHTNISSSIESFVQESGRAGRDGKTALSIVLYSNQIGRDRQVLDNFYKTSFKGADKERSVIWELRNRIFFPSITHLRLLNDKLNEEFDEEFILKSKPADTYLWVNDNAGNSVINIRLSDKKPFTDSQRPGLTDSIYDFIKNFIPNFLSLTSEQIKAYFTTQTVNTDARDGLEQLLNHDDFDFNEEVIIPFKNAFYSKDEKGGFDITDDFAFEKHYTYFQQSNSIQRLIANNVIAESNLKSKFKDGIKWDNSFEEFVNSLPLTSENDKSHLLETAMLRVRYYIPRNQSDTAKAIYRLASIGVIDTYTIEYQQQVYKVKLSRKAEGAYFDNYKTLVARYTSREEARKLRQECEDDFTGSENATVISKCLEHLTKFIYEKIADKRKRAINDMVGLCDETISIINPIQQSEKIKENIYYYFNAKYARENNIATLHTGETISADLNMDFRNNLSIDDTVWKYIEQIIDFDDNGAIINNIKHLRGATMRMLRGTSGAPQFNILKSYSLYILSANSPQLIPEAIEELKIGIQEWNELEPDEFQFEPFFLRFKDSIKRHLGETPDELFGDVDDDYYVTRNLTWLKRFNPNFLKDYSNANTTSNR